MLVLFIRIDKCLDQTLGLAKVFNHARRRHNEVSSGFSELQVEYKPILDCRPACG